jgi:hypothetical protein
MIDHEAVDAVLARARLTLSAEDFARLVRLYPLIQSQLAELRLAEVRYLEPA